MKRSVLVIDDDLDTVSLISLVLEQENYEVVSTTKVDEGLEYFYKFHPAVLIMDLEMPSMHGVQVLKKIHPGIDKDFSVIIMTGYGHDTNVKICYDLGVYAFLSKPVRLVELKGLVRNAMLWEEYKQALTEHKNELEKLVDKRTGYLSQEIELRKNTEQQLIEANQIRDRILDILTMDLRAPLSNVVMNLRYLYENKKLVDNKVFLQIEDIYREARNTWQLTDNIFLWARCQKGEVFCNAEPCNIYSLVKDIVLTLSTLAEMKQLNFEIQIEKSLEVVTDRNLVNTILNNLISNAIKYSFSKGKITVSAEKRGKQICITVTDNGTGIGKDILPFLTDISKPVSTPGTLNEKGSGLGLTICKELSKILSGELNIDSIVGKGTIVSLCLPFTRTSS